MAEGGRIAVDTDCGVMLCDLPPWTLDGEDVLVVFRPESVRLEPAGSPVEEANVLPGTVQSGIFTGDAVEYEIDVAGRSFTVRADAHQPLPAAGAVILGIRPEHCLIVNRRD